MPRPRDPLRKIIPGIYNQTHAALLIDDLGAQIITTTLVANSVAAVNIILNSLRSSNVVWDAKATRSSLVANFTEITSPTTSAVFIHVTALSGANAAALGALGNIVARVVILQTTN